MPAADQVVELVVNLDDVTPQLVGHAQTALMDAGALDCWTTPILMKKQRPGVCLSLLCRPADADALATRVLELTGSFGVRRRMWDRVVLDRHHETVDTPYGSVRIKVGQLDGRVIVRRPEYEDVRTLAQQRGVPLRDVMAAAEEASR